MLVREKKSKNLSSPRLRFGVQWFENLPILSKLVTVLLTLDILVFMGFTVIEVYVERDEAGELLGDQAKAELATVENIYINSIEQAQSVAEAQAENMAIINAAEQYNENLTINPELQERVNQILQNTELNSETAQKAFLVGKDLNIIAGSQPERIGDIFNPYNLVRSVFSSSEKIAVNQVVNAQEIKNKFPDFSSLSPSKNILVQYIFTPVTTWETEEVQGVLVSAKLITGKDSILDRSVFTIGGGYHAIYLQQPNGEFVLAASLLDLESHDFGQHHNHNPDNHLNNISLPNTDILSEVIAGEGKTVTQRMFIEGSQYTVAAKTLTNTRENMTVILVRGTPEVEILGLINRSIKRQISLFVLIILLTLFFSITLARLIAKPLKDLQRKTQEFSQGNLEVRAQVSRTDEIGQLALMFNQMADGILAAFDQEAANTETQLRLNKELKQQIEERHKVENKLKISLREKETLLKEIHHRVKNNLFVVSNLLEFQTDYFDDPKLIQALEDSRNRIYSMALIHQQLYRSTNLHQIDFSSYLEQLVENLFESYNQTEDEIKCHLKIKPVFLNVETAHPCGLIVNELISNVFKHAFPETGGGDVWLGLHQERSGEVVLSVKDNGVGFPKGVNFRQVNSLGMELICTLTQQLEGTIELKRKRGTLFTVRFYELKYCPRIPV
ncbi:sensor histidine kinase [Capilliphycus salinus ALCB114379]|uniref:sensor histidine kinase n=1 Tax=Capilliphycus salinus TaxID=2768948 RepID=UPI0039A72F67